jgi:hypothetical protein
MNNVFAFIIWLISFPGCATKSPQSNIQDESYGLEKTIYDYESTPIDSSELIKRSDSNIVYIMFFGNFEDTVTFQINGEEKCAG